MVLIESVDGVLPRDIIEPLSAEDVAATLASAAKLGSMRIANATSVSGPAAITVT